MIQKILIVEDEPAIADTIIYALKTDGFESAWCTTGGEAIQQLDSGHFNLVILDVGLPDQSGFEVCKLIRKSSQVPVIFLTARTGEVDRVVGLEIGADDYVSKPFSPRELTARIKAVLRRVSSSEQQPESTIAPSPFHVDEQKLRVVYLGKPLDLSKYEFRILEVLLRHPGWVYSREKLMELAWESPENSTDRTVDAHIKNIRAKLREINPDADPICTHRGLGYSVRESL